MSHSGVFRLHKLPARMEKQDSETKQDLLHCKPQDILTFYLKTLREQFLKCAWCKSPFRGLLLAVSATPCLCQPSPQASVLQVTLHAMGQRTRTEEIGCCLRLRQPPYIRPSLPWCCPHANGLRRRAGTKPGNLIMPPLQRRWGSDLSQRRHGSGSPQCLRGLTGGCALLWQSGLLPKDLFQG